MCQVVNEYERAIIFRLGRLKRGGAVGPGLFFVVPCTDQYIKVDLRTFAYDVPPQEVCVRVMFVYLLIGFFCLCVCQSVYLCVRVSVCLSVCLSVCQ